jgi:multiple sugar transport system substrate-binding protein
MRRSQKYFLDVNVLFRLSRAMGIGNTICVIILLVTTSIMITVLYSSPHTINSALATQKEKLTLTAVFNQLSNDGQIGKVLVQRALDQMRAVHPNLDVQLKYVEYPYNQTRTQMLKILNQTTIAATMSGVDLVSLDQIWLGEFAQKGLLTDLTSYTNKWGRSSDW